MATLEGLDTVLGNWDKQCDRWQTKSAEAIEQITTAMEGWAKSEHSYTDRTSNNTNSIRGFVAEASPTIIRGVLTAGMSYSVFLELARDSKWAFLLPVVTRHRADIIKILKQALGAK